MISTELFLRDVVETDLPLFYQDQLDPEAIHMVAFTPREREVFDQHWLGTLADPTIKKQTVVYQDEVAGYVLVFNRSGEREIGYWISKKFWGQGIASRAVMDFLQLETARPLCAHIAKHNKASMRVLEKCGFRIVGEDKEFAKVGEKIIVGVVMRLAS